MKRWMIVAAALVLVSLQLSAQQERRTQPTPEERAQKLTEKMSTELDLSEEQKDQILSLNLDQAKRRQDEIEQQAAERKARMEEMKAHQERIKAILTPEQRAKWEEIRLEQREKRRPGGQVHDRDEIPRHREGN